MKGHHIYKEINIAVKTARSASSLLSASRYGSVSSAGNSIRLREASKFFNFFFSLICFFFACCYNYSSNKTESECFGNEILNFSPDTFTSNSIGIMVSGFSKLL